ncbi:hypothetical protein SE17_17310 [Kouleothrix aurantiaca]|uniref:Response regulatory domain-containing protein n=1 Tax=Kouleothrix aurantiaca TaxID=186479 RepID=A0A0N8PS98_9CHLR|nr:hypothetical protein SE17_17310 [Kouleothrix aurantiaca]
MVTVPCAPGGEQTEGDVPTQVLIVDDSPLVAAVVARLIEREGYVSQAVHSGQAALEYVHESQPDLILLDVTMPPPDGFTVCQMLKQNPATAHIPILLLTGLDDVSASEHGQQVGANGVVTKPFNTPDLLMAMRMLLQRHAVFPPGAAD